MPIKVFTRKGGRYVRAPQYPFPALRWLDAAGRPVRRSRTARRRKPRQYKLGYITRSSRMYRASGAPPRFWYRYKSLM